MCAQPNLPRLFVLADSISIHYGPYLEQFLVGRFVCNRKGHELLAAGGEASAGGEDERSIFRDVDEFDPLDLLDDLGFTLDEEIAAAEGLNHGNGHATPAAPEDSGVLARLGRLDPGIAEINGGDSRAVVAYLRERRPQCEVVLLNCGLHALRVDPESREHQVPLDEYARNLDEILALAKSCAQQVMWVRTTPVDDVRHNRLSVEFMRFNADVLAYNAAADACLRSAGIATANLYEFTLNLAGGEDGGLVGLIEDHVHFTTAARKLQGAYLAGQLEALRGC